MSLPEPTSLMFCRNCDNTELKSVISFYTTQDLLVLLDSNCSFIVLDSVLHFFPNEFEVLTADKNKEITDRINVLNPNS